MYRLLGIFVVLPSVALAQQQPTPAVPSVAGSYVLNWAGDTGCALQVAPTSADSVRLQIRCTNPPPGYHIGFLDARLPIRRDTVVYTRNEYGGPCAILVRFTSHDATQNGSDLACGFGASVSVSGVYRRATHTPPPFDLNPCG